MPSRSIESIKHAPRVRVLEVRRTALTAPRYRLVTLGGDELADFVTSSPTDHVGVIPPSASGDLLLPEVIDGRLHWPTPRPPMREYTVRRFDPASGELDVRFLMHGGGPVSSWAGAATPGERIGVVGPLVSDVMPDGYSNYLLLGDPTAIPAIARWLSILPEGATAQVLIAARSDDDVIKLHCAQPISVRWLTEGGYPEAEQLPHALADLELYTSDTFAWAAGEAVAMRAVRRILLEKPGLSAEAVKVTGYWRRDRSGFDHEAPLEAD
jgi:NADPH-dependent ferric siderophore reductase